MKEIKSLCLMGLIAGLLWLGGSLGTEASAAGPNPCSGDIDKFCSGSVIRPGPAGMAALMECLEEHEKELSEDCRDFEAGMGGARMERSEAMRAKRQFRQTCMDEMARLCKDASPTQGGMMQCLTEHEGALSTPCSQSLKALR